MRARRNPCQVLIGSWLKSAVAHLWQYRFMLGKRSLFSLHVCTALQQLHAFNLAFWLKGRRELKPLRSGILGHLPSAQAGLWHLHCGRLVMEPLAIRICASSGHVRPSERIPRKTVQPETDCLGGSIERLGSSSPSTRGSPIRLPLGSRPEL